METISKAQHSTAATAAQPSFKVPGFLERVMIKLTAFFKRTNMQPFEGIERASYGTFDSKQVIDLTRMDRIKQQNTTYHHFMELPALKILSSQLKQQQEELSALQSQYHDLTTPRVIEPTQEEIDSAASYLTAATPQAYTIEPTREELAQAQKLRPQIQALEHLVSETKQKLSSTSRAEATAKGYKNVPQKRTIDRGTLAIQDNFSKLASRIHATSQRTGMDARQVAVLSMPLFVSSTDIANLQNAFARLPA